MSCCPSVPEIFVAEVTPDEPTMGPETERLPGESEDCFIARTGNVSETGSVADKIIEVPDKIQQNSIVTKGDASIDLTFTTTGPTAVTSWLFTPASFPGVAMNNVTGKMVGVFDPAVHKTKLTLRVKAMDGPNVIDDRTYDFSPSIYDDSSSIRLVHPLPGSILTCKFGPRRPPTQGASSQHMGVDMAYSGGITKDVMCAADGEIILARPGSGYGNYVMVKHLDASGKHLITTLYAHLNSIYVRLGQKVMGGQAVGKEGNTGVGTGAHLHFEVRLPNGTKVDPVPYLQGAVVVANGVTNNNQPDGSGTSAAVDGGKGVTAAEVAARSSCAQFGPTYPAPAIAPLVPPPDTDPFEKAWFFTMTAEVNPLWATTPDRSPTDPAVAAGLIDTPEHVQRVGYVEHPGNAGGTTKFGVAQKYNTSVKVSEMDYATARSTGYNVYWLSPQVNCSTFASAKIAVFAFDMNYLMGAGGSKSVMTAAGVTGAETGTAELAALDALHAGRVARLRTSPNWNKFGRGWTRRSADCLAYAKTV